MAKSINIPSAVYPPGVISRTIDSFPVGVTRIIASFTREAWPGTPSDTVAIVRATWGDGSGAEFSLPGGVILDKQGLPLAASQIEIGVPIDREGDGKKNRNVVDGTLTFTVIQTLRTAITAEAL